MLEGRPPKECRRCLAEERAGFKSKRQRAENLWKGTKAEDVHADVSDLIQMEVVLGNLCNLKCMMCHPRDSSAWNQDAETAGYEKSALEKLDPNALIPYCKSLRRVDLLGGETFLIKELEGVLEILVRYGQPEKMLLTFTTNATVFPSLKIRKLIEKFGRVELSCSVDAVGRRNEYIRFPSKWIRMERNLSRFLEWKDQNQQMGFQIESVVSAYSFPGLPELLAWWRNFAAEHSVGAVAENIWLNTLLTPDFQSVHVLPRKVRLRVVKALGCLETDMKRKMEEIGRFALAQDAPQLLPKLREWTEALDRARGLNGREIVPEIFEAEDGL